MIIQGQVGQISANASLPSGLSPSLRLGNMGDLITSKLHGGYYEAAYRRALFSAANQSETVTTVGLATTYTGLALSNPSGSPVNLVINRVAAAFIVAFPAGAVIGVMAGYNFAVTVTHTTPVTPQNMLYGLAGAGYGKVDAACTFPTAPVLVKVLGSGHTGAITTAVTSSIAADLDGSLILPPGAYAAIYTSTVSGTAGFIGSFTWEEVPI